MPASTMKQATAAFLSLAIIICAIPAVSGLVAGESKENHGNSTSVDCNSNTCNGTVPEATKSPACCVTFSAFYAEEAIPCTTCACGCPVQKNESTCDPDAQAVLLPPEALLLPFDNRSAITDAWSKTKNLSLPKMMPCADHCGISINWHLFSEDKNGWSARITLFNWGEHAYTNWSTTVQLPLTSDGYEKVDTYKGKMDGKREVNHTLIFRELEGMNILPLADDPKDPMSKPRIPGKEQFIVTFTKNSPGINITGGDGFPRTMYFNGADCVVPNRLPSSHGSHVVATGGYMVVGFVMLLLIV